MKVSGAKALPMLLLVVVMAGLLEQGEGYNCGSTFFSALVQLIPCRPAVAPFSPASPSEACCNAVMTLGQPCLCVLVNGPPISGIDRNMAMQLPDKCTTNFEPCGLRKLYSELEDIANHEEKCGKSYEISDAAIIK